MAIIQELSEYFSVSGGHPRAVGFTLKDKNQFDEFKTKIIALAEQKLGDLETALTQDIDTEIALKQVDWLLFEDLEKFEPLGEANPRPLFLCRGVEIVGLENVGLENKHIRLLVAQNGAVAKKMIGFCLSEACTNLCIGDKIDVLFEVSVNEWNGNRELQLKLIDFQITE
jgi:single-stranded-DNA-specific exonuclease